MTTLKHIEQRSPNFHDYTFLKEIVWKEHNLEYSDQKSFARLSLIHFHTLGLQTEGVQLGGYMRGKYTIVICIWTPETQTADKRVWSLDRFFFS